MSGLIEMLKKPRDLVLFPAKITAPTQVIKVEFSQKKGIDKELE